MTAIENPKSKIQNGLSPFTPMQHCPQCDGAIDQRCVRTSPIRARSYPRRRVEAFCDFCTVGFQADYELRDIWELLQIRVLVGDQARSIRTFAESQTNTRNIATESTKNTENRKRNAPGSVSSVSSVALTGGTQ